MSSDPLALLIAGFALTTVAGGALAYVFQRRGWDHQHTVQREDLAREQSLKAFEEVSVLLDQRLYRMRQVYWAAKRRAMTGDRSPRLDAALTAYRAVLQQWNDNLNRILALVHTYFGEPIRQRLQLELYATYAAIGEELEEFVREVTAQADTRAPLRPIGRRLDELERRVYNFNVEALRVFGGSHLALTATQEVPFSPSLPMPPRFGVEGQLVREVQEALRRAGATVSVDGHFGRSTETALKEFQRSHDLPADGVAGPVTLSALQVDS